MPPSLPAVHCWWDGSLGPRVRRVSAGCPDQTRLILSLLQVRGASASWRTLRQQQRVALQADARPLRPGVQLSALLRLAGSVH